MRRPRYGYKGADSAGIGIWNWLLILSEQKIGYVLNQHRAFCGRIKDAFIQREISLQAITQTPKDSDAYIQKNWGAFKAFSRGHFLEISAEFK